MKTVVIDTPGMCNTCLTTSEVKNYLRDSIDCISPGPYALIYVLPLRGQMDEDQSTLKEMIDVFSDEMFRSTIIVFTDSDISEVLNNCTLKEYLRDMPDYVVKLIDRCERRYTVLSFDGHEHKTNMTRLFFHFQKMQEDTSYYNSHSLRQQITPIILPITVIMSLFGCCIALYKRY